MLNFEITYKSTFSVEWPKIKVYNNDSGKSIIIKF